VKRLLQRGCRRMTGRFEQKLDALGIAGRDERKPGRFADRNVVFDFKAEHAGVKTAGAILVVDQNAHQFRAYHQWLTSVVRAKTYSSEL
jgi:hypothetical protein